MKKFFTVTLAIFATINSAMSQTALAMPVNINFDSPNAANDWTFYSNNTTNYWMIGNSTGNANNSLYITNDGINHTFTPVYTCAAAYFTVDFGDGSDYKFSFDWKCNFAGVGNRMEIYIIPENKSIPATWSYVGGNWITGAGVEKIGTIYYTESNWKHESFVLSNANYAGTTKKIVFMFGASFVQDGIPPAIDNVVIDKISECSTPTSITFSDITHEQAKIKWIGNEPNQNYNVIVSTTDLHSNLNLVDLLPQSEIIANLNVVNADSVFITGLTTGITYYCYIKMDCGNGDYSNWTTSFFTTHCEGCYYTLNLHSPSGNWDGAKIRIKENGIEIGSYTLLTGYNASFLLHFCQNSNIELYFDDVWYSMGMSFELLDSNSDTIYRLVTNHSYELSQTYPIFEFTACQQICPAQELPWTENFDSYHLNSIMGSCSPRTLIPTCMNRVFGGVNGACNGYYPAMDGECYSLPNSLKFDGGVNQMITTPKFIDEVNLMKLTFKAHKYYQHTNINIIVGAMSNPHDVSTFIPVATFTLTNNTWQIFTTYFSSIPDNYHYIAFRCYDSNDLWFNIDDIIVDYNENLQNTCLPPSDLVFTNVTTNSANIMWSIVGENETSWDIVVSENFLSNPSSGNIINTNMNNYLLSLLSPATNYHVYVRANCGNGEASQWTHSMLTTFCEPINKCNYTLKLYSDNQAGWQSGVNITIKQNGNIVYSDGLRNHGNYKQDIIALCPNMPTTIELDSISYYNAKFELFDTNGSLIVTHNQIMRESPFLFSFIPYCTNCLPPTDVNISNISDTQAQVLWTPNGSESSWNIIVSETEITNFVTVNYINLDTNFYTLSNLTESTHYFIYVQTDCGNGVSAWSKGKSFWTSENTVINAGEELVFNNSTHTIDMSCGANSIMLFVSDTSQIIENYTVSSIPYYLVCDLNIGTQILTNQDDMFSPLITLPFDFSFYGNIYNQATVGSNCLISFNAANANTVCPASTTPYHNIPDAAMGTKFLNAIYGVMQEVRCSAIGSPDKGVYGTIRYATVGTEPNRKFAVSFSGIPIFSDLLNFGYNEYQIVLHETTNIIDVSIEKRTQTINCNDGRGVVGVQNINGTKATAPLGRNLEDTWWVYNDIPPESWRFTPTNNFAPVWYEGAGTAGNILVNGEYTFTANYSGNAIDTITITQYPYTQDTVVIKWRTEITITDTINQNEGDLYPNFQIPNETGSYILTDTLRSEQNCDSIVILNITILPLAPVELALTTTSDTEEENALLLTWDYTPETAASAIAAETVLRAANQGITFKVYRDNVFVAEVTEMRYVDTDVVCGETYCYKVRVTETNGITSGYSNEICAEFSPLGLENILMKDIKLFPNPAKDEIFISSELQINKVEVYSLTGLLLLSDNNFNKKISVSTLPQGVYMVKVYTNDGVAIIKVVKK